ncbi:MAG: hypothetical protein CL908_01305 [Deltaproteobacteria bacterium]|jgi:dienelactone hydrolase|nr:hypothetical protein [Deltaproteobacteria bacterium]
MDEALCDHTERGPYAVGVCQTTVMAGEDSDLQLPTEIWYPAHGPASEADLPDDAPHPLGLSHRAKPDLPAIDVPCPLIVFSHGNSGFRQQSTFLTTHLASWGAVVAAPDHVGNTFTEMLALADEEARRDVHVEMRARRPGDLRDVVAALLDERVANLPPLDGQRLGLLGHSFGGWTALKGPALEPRARAVCSLAPVSEPFVGRKAFAAGELPLPKGIRSLVLAARDDVLVDLDTSILPLFERLGPDAALEVIDGADHFHFCDGIELLHRMHENNPREGQHRPTRPFVELRSEREMHALLNERVTRFFSEVLELADAGEAEPASR